MIATGVQWRRLDAPGIDRLQGAGVYYGGGATEALVLQGRDRLCGRRRQFGRAGGHELRQVRGTRRDAGARRFARQHHVAISDRSDQGDAEHSDLGARQRGRSSWRQRIWKRFPCSVPTPTRSSACRRARCSSSSAPCRAPTGWADLVERDERGFILTGPDLDARRRATRRAGRSIAIRSCWKPMSRAFLPSAMCATVP